jgi:hypothetical protein
MHFIRKQWRHRLTVQGMADVTEIRTLRLIMHSNPAIKSDNAVIYNAVLEFYGVLDPLCSLRSYRAAVADSLWRPLVILQSRPDRFQQPCYTLGLVIHEVACT